MYEVFNQILTAAYGALMVLCSSYVFLTLALVSLWWTLWIYS
jgi:hypothetical protein